MRSQPNVMAESPKGLPAVDATRELVMNNDMHATRPASICGSDSFNKPSMPSSLESVVNLLSSLPINTSTNDNTRAKTRKRTCFAKSAAPGSYRRTRRTLPPHPERGAYRPHGKTLSHLLPQRGTRHAAAACMRRNRL